jgi:PAS domain S-box-containing protein
MNIRLPFTKGPLAGYVVALLLLLAAGLLAYRGLTRLIADEAWVEHTHVVLLRLESVISLLKDAETAQRGYLLTGENEFLEPLRDAQRRTLAHQRALDSLTADNPAQQRRLDTLRTLVAGRFADWQASLRGYQRGRGYPLATLRQSKAGMDQARAVVRRLQAAENALLARRQAQSRCSTRTAPPLVAALTALSLLVVGLTHWRLHRSRRAEQRAGGQVRDRESTLQAILDASPDGITLYDVLALPGPDRPVDFRLRLLNPAAAAGAITTAADLGRRMSELFPDSVASGRLARYQQVMATGQPWETEVHRADSGRWFRLVAARAGQYLLLTSADVTDRKQAEQAALDYQQRKYEAVFNQTTQVMCLLDTEGRLLDVNRTGMSQMTSSPQPYLGHYWADLPAWTATGMAGQLRDGIARASRGEPVRFDVVLQPPGQPARHLDLSLTSVQGPDGDTLFLLAEVRDITPRVQAEQALQASLAELHELSQTLEARVQQRTQLLEESRARFAQLLETIPNMAWTALPDGTLTYYNQLWYDYTGATFELLADRGWRDFIHPDDLGPTAEAWQEALRSGVPITGLRNRWKRARDGEWRWHLVRAVPLRDAATGATVLWVGSNTDIHAQQLQQQELERVNADLDTFVYTASHDLRTPISNIESLLTALREELTLPPAEADALPLLDLMQGAVDRFKRTIAHLTEITKLQKAGPALPAAPVDLAVLIDDVRLDLQPLLQATGGQLAVHLPAGQTLLFAEKNLRSIVFNLLSNAIKYRHPECAPQVQLRGYPTADAFVLEVQDNGLGLDDAQQAKLFGLFRRLHDHVEGSGVGLYTVKKIMDNAGGRIEVESQPGVGSVFRAYFPA